MKRIISIFVLFCMSCMMITTEVLADTSSNEMKAVWVTSVYNQDWPSSSSKNNVQAQKQEFINLLDDIKELGFNTVIVQVRPKGDALYKSEINPWSDVLTGVQGKDPGYDPLSFITEESHKRGIKVHAWLNPYRVTTSGTNLESLSESHFARKNPETVLEYRNGDKSSLVYNPGLPEVRQHIVDTVTEIVRNYNVDGIHFDDYFYPGKDVNDIDAYNQYGNGQSIEDFRRNSVNEMVKVVYNTVKSIDSNVEFGISPRGIWKNQSSDSTGSQTNGAQSYYDIYADTRTWIKNQWLDYVVPQIYWEIGNNAADYSKLVPWWVNEVSGTNVDLYIGQGIYKPEVAREIESQINLNRKYSQVKGSIYFSYRDIKNDLEGIRAKLEKLYRNPENPKEPDSSVAGVSYTTHVENIGWQEWKYNEQTSGTVGENKRLEGIQIKVNQLPNNAQILYRTHVQDYGWQAWKSNGQLSGTTGESKRLEGIEIKLDGAPANYHVEYRVHVEDYGWQPWRRDGEMAGTQGESKRLEAVEIRIVEDKIPEIKYQGHVENDGWQSWRSAGEIAGTEGQSKRVEGIRIQVENVPGINIAYSTHVEDYGWQDWKRNGEVAGTEGESKRLEAIQVKLENAPSNLHVEYRVHVENHGWQDWKRDGQVAGTEGESKRLEAIQIRVVTN